MNRAQRVAALAIILTVSIATIITYSYLRGSEGYIQVKFYNVNSENYFLVQEERGVKYTEDTDVFINSIFQESKKQPRNTNLASPWPPGIEVVESGFLNSSDYYISFSDNYNSLDYAQETLFRTSLAKTLIDTPESKVKNVYFSIGQKPIPAGLGTENTAFNKDNLALCPQISPQRSSVITVTLYFIDPASKKLVPIERNITTTGDQNDGKYVLEELMKGPGDIPGLMKIFESNVTLRDFSRRSNTCYIEFSPEFKTMFSPDPEIAELQLYAIVNSLTSLQEIKLVKFYINADSQVNIGNISNLDFNDTFEENQSLVIE
ncbi:MAG: GerMN domain-containing protein [Clostridiales bacterium]|nr:GerMN domain-containing protein [Clostridiales bacterium]